MATPQAAPPPHHVGNGLAVAGMVLGILGLVLCWIPFVGAAAALVGLILSALGISKANKRGASGKGMAIAGLVCGIIGLIVSIIFIWLTMAAVKGFDDYVKKGRKTEASLQLRRMEMKIKSFRNEKGSFPKSASEMPALAGTACSGGTNKLPRKSEAEWNAAGWGEMGFHVDEDSHYSYRWTSTGTGGYAEAMADLDCDGTVSTTRVDFEVIQGTVAVRYSDPTPD